MNPFLKLALELGPLVIFFAANARFGIFNATAIFMVAIFIALVASWVLTRHLPIMAIVTAVLVGVFGTLTLVLHDDTFIKIKPTIIYAIFGGALAGGLLFGRSLISILFDSVFSLTPRGWRILSIRWAIFFFAMAALNEIVWRTQTTEFWVAFKAFGVLPLTLLFGATQYPVLTRHQVPDDGKADAKDGAQDA
jgi:intracellular septation protein